jgi:hypothetical protein
LPAKTTLASTLVSSVRTQHPIQRSTSDRTMPRYDNILDTIGHTPLVRLNKLAPPGVTVYAKLESFNPLGSV